MKSRSYVRSGVSATVIMLMLSLAKVQGWSSLSPLLCWIDKLPIPDACFQMPMEDSPCGGERRIDFTTPCPDTVIVNTGQEESNYPGIIGQCKYSIQIPDESGYCTDWKQITALKPCKVAEGKICSGPDSD